MVPQAQRPLPSPAANIRRAIRLNREDGQYSKAVKSLLSHGVASPSAAVTAELRSKHPSHALPMAPPNINNFDPIEADISDLVCTLQSFRKGKRHFEKVKLVV